MICGKDEGIGRGKKGVHGVDAGTAEDAGVKEPAQDLGDLGPCAVNTVCGEGVESANTTATDECPSGLADRDTHGRWAPYRNPRSGCDPCIDQMFKYIESAQHDDRSATTPEEQYNLTLDQGIRELSERIRRIRAPKQDPQW